MKDTTWLGKAIVSLPKQASISLPYMVYKTNDQKSWEDEKKTSRCNSLCIKSGTWTET